MTKTELVNERKSSYREQAACATCKHSNHSASTCLRITFGKTKIIPMDIKPHGWCYLYEQKGGDE